MRVLRLAGAQSLADGCAASEGRSGELGFEPWAGQLCWSSQACGARLSPLDNLWSPLGAPLLSAVPAFPGLAFIWEEAALYRGPPLLYTQFYCIFFLPV